MENGFVGNLVKEDRKCKRCGIIYKPTAKGQKYCGSQKLKSGCSYVVGIEKHNKYIREHKQEMKEYQRIWNKNFQKTNEYKQYLEKRKARYAKFRFSILSRDNFRCAYCGRTAKEATLQIDHIFPKSCGGKTQLNNLITACAECNLGKCDTILEENCNG